MPWDGDWGEIHQFTKMVAYWFNDLVGSQVTPCGMGTNLANKPLLVVPLPLYNETWDHHEKDRVHDIGFFMLKSKKRSRVVHVDGFI